MGTVINAGNLHAYKSWRAKIKALPEGTILVWNTGYKSDVASTIKPGQCYKIVKVRRGLFSRIDDHLDASKGYDLQLCTRSGKLYKRTQGWSVENIARRIEDGTITVLEQEGETNDEGNSGST